MVQTMTNHPITPPLELVRQWYQESDRQLTPYYVYMAHRAAQWAADQELEACCEWTQGYAECGDALRLARRSKPLNLKKLKEQALRDLNHAYNKDQIDDTTFENIQEALEALPND